MKLDGVKLAATRRATLADKVDRLGQTLTLGIIVATDDPATQSYIAAKRKAAEAVGYGVEVRDLGAAASEQAIIAACQRFNDDSAVTGYIVQLPLPPDVDQTAVLSSVAPGKDADGLSPQNLGLLASGHPRVVPATPKGVLSLLEAHGVELVGRHVVVIGRGLLTGAPLSVLLGQRGATVTTCTRQTTGLATHTRSAEVIIAAAGVPGLVTEKIVSPHTVIVDIGTTMTPDGLAGDVDYEPVSAKVKAVSPVPGGVGPMTVVSLLENIYELALLREKKSIDSGAM